MIHENLLQFRRGKYFWWATTLTVVSILLYVSQNLTFDRGEPPNGGTWQGYVLGTIGALLIVWLALLGIRKRRYGSTMGSVQGWTSAHVYLGLTLFVVATLHCAAQFGWNVHTLAYALMIAVILSGVYGVYSYLVYPRRMSFNRAGGDRAELFGELYELDAKGRELARQCDPEVQLVVASAIERTEIGGGVIAQLFGVDRSRVVRRGNAEGRSTASSSASNRDQQAVIDFVATRSPRANKRAEAANLQALLSILCRRQAILRRIRADVRMQGWLGMWLYVHVPLTVALLGALTVHILSTFFYW